MTVVVLFKFLKIHYRSDLGFVHSMVGFFSHYQMARNPMATRLSLQAIVICLFEFVYFLVEGPFRIVLFVIILALQQPFQIEVRDGRWQLCLAL